MIELDTKSIKKINEILTKVLDGSEIGDFVVYFTQSFLEKLKSKNISRTSAEQLLHLQLIDNKYEVEQVYTFDKKRAQYKIRELYKLNLHTAINTPEQWQLIEDEIDTILGTADIENTNEEAYPTDSNKYIIIDNNKKQIVEEVERYNGKTERTLIAGAVPTNVKIHQNPFLEEVTLCDIDWRTQLRSTPLKMRDCSRSEVKEFLKQNGLVFNQSRVKDVIPLLLYNLQIHGKVEVDTNITTPGAFWLQDEQTIITKELHTISNATYEEELEAIDLLEDYVSYFPNQEDKIATILKWGWISPFGFVTKQLGYEWIPGIFLHGKAQSGKTEGYGYPVLYMYDEPKDGYNDIGGGSVDTVARLGQYISASTKALLVNEPGKLFQTKATKDMFKNCVDKKTARGKFEDYTVFRNIPAYASLFVTSNHSLPDDDSLRRRLIVLNTGRTENTSKTKDEFTKKFKPSQTQTSPLNKLKIISNYVVQRIKEEPTLLEDWKEAINEILSEFYLKHSRDMPFWLLSWKEPETLEDLDHNKKTTVREAVVHEIIQAYKKETKKPLANVPYCVVVAIAIESAEIPWIKYKSRKGDTYAHEVAFSSGFRNWINRMLDEEESLKDISDLLDWEYAQRIKAFGGNSGIYTSMDDLLSFLFPAEEQYYYSERYISPVETIDLDNNPFIK